MKESLHYFSGLINVLILFLLNSLIFAQEDFFYVQGERIPLTISEEKISLKFKSGITENEIQSLFLSEPAL
ncbi:MAG: hypothetical protein GWN00_29350, partial [Aliifodinibius sp.]|nr:hypothetical protein [Fodinibius sp.]NIY28754.1 hypothetical protein [Fodinibius sp.]